MEVYKSKILFEKKEKDELKEAILSIRRGYNGKSTVSTRFSKKKRLRRRYIDFEDIIGTFHKVRELLTRVF